jgi:hypothetical protein
MNNLVRSCHDAFYAGQSILAAHAEGNALGKGPIIFHFPKRVISK